MFKNYYFAIAFIASLLAVSQVQAATVNPGPLTITYEGDDKIFSEMNIEPGDKIRKELTVTNNGRVAHNLAIATRNVSGELGSKIYISAIENGINIWTNTILELSNLPTESKFITSLNSGQTKTIVLEANFPSSSENDAAGKTVSFDIVYGTEESEPAARTFSIFSTNATSTSVAQITPSAVTSQAVTAGEVKGDKTNEEGINPWYLAIAPVAAVASIVFLPEFIFVSSMAAVTGGAAYVLGYSSKGTMDPVLFYSILIAEIIVLIILAYFMLHHDNRASRRIKNYRHRLRIR